MVIVWQGYGWLAIVVPFLVLIAGAVFAEHGAAATLLGSGLTALIGGGLSFRVSRPPTDAPKSPDAAKPLSTRASENPHTLYFIPLWVWGWGY